MTHTTGAARGSIASRDGHWDAIPVGMGMTRWDWEGLRGNTENYSRTSLIGCLFELASTTRAL